MLLQFSTLARRGSGLPAATLERHGVVQAITMYRGQLAQATWVTVIAGRLHPACLQVRAAVLLVAHRAALRGIPPLTSERQ